MAPARARWTHWVIIFWESVGLLAVERTLAGLAAARARGRTGGRPPVMTPLKIKKAREMYEAGEYTVEAIAETLGVSRKTVYRHLG